MTLMPSPTVSSLDTEPSWAVTVLDRHLVESQVVVQRVDGHFHLDLEAARQHGVGFDEREAERAVSGHDIGDVRAEQPVDGAAHEAVAEVVERALVLLEVCGGEAVADDHIVAFEHLGDHVGRGGDFGRAVGGVVVVHVDGRVGQRRTEVAHHLANGHLFVIARQENGDGLISASSRGHCYTR